MAAIRLPIIRFGLKAQTHKTYTYFNSEHYYKDCLPIRYDPREMVEIDNKPIDSNQLPLNLFETLFAMFCAPGMWMI